MGTEAYWDYFNVYEAYFDRPSGGFDYASTWAVSQEHGEYLLSDVIFYLGDVECRLYVN